MTPEHDNTPLAAVGSSEIDDDHTGVIETRIVHNVHRHATSLLADAIRVDAAIDALRELRDFIVPTLHHHHRIEDHDLWPLLVAAAPALSRDLEGLSKDHERLDAALDDLATVDVDKDADRRRLTAYATTVRDLVHEHLAHEEPILFPALREHVSDQTWDGFSQRAVATAPAEANHLMVGFLEDVGTREEVDLVLRHLPAEAREHLPAMRAQASATLDALRCDQSSRSEKSGLSARRPAPTS
jgi:hemerythrin-like domain-containing protein